MKKLWLVLATFILVVQISYAQGGGLLDSPIPFSINKILALVLLFGALTYGVYRWRVRGIEQRLAAVEERERIGRELYDDLGQIMGYFSVQIQVLEKFLAQGQIDEVQALLRQLKMVAEKAHDDIRQYILGSRTKERQRDPDFFKQLDHYLNHLQTRYNLEIQTSWPDELLHTSLVLEVETHLLRIIQEASTNVRKQARVRSVRHPDQLSEEDEDAQPSLTPRQEEVLALIKQGLTNKEIALTLHVTEPTVKYHVSQILERFQVRSRYEIPGDRNRW